MIRWPLLGHLPAVARGPFRFLAGLHRMGAVVRVDVGRLPVYLLTEPALVHRVLVTDARAYTKGRLFDRVRPLLGNGLVTADRATHQRQRRLIQPAFHRARIAGYADVMRRHADALARSWRPGQVVELNHVLHELTLNSVAETMFSAAPSDTATDEIRRWLPVFSRATAVRALLPRALDRLPHRRFDTAVERLGAVLDDVIGHSQHDQRDQHDRGDLLSMLLAARDADTGEPMSDRQLRDELLTILNAGTETSAAALAWTFHHLGQHPEIAERVRAEVAAAGTVTMADLPKLAYTDRVLTEAIRLHSVPLVMRRSTTAVRLGGHDLPPGTEVVISPYAMHRDPRWFPAPARFDPDRWAPERATRLPKGAFVPFGEGARKCVGDVFAQTEMLIALASVLARWRLTPVPGGHRVREVFAGVPRPRSLPMIVTPAG